MARLKYLIHNQGLEWFKAKGMPMLHVPYKGGEAAMNAVISGDAQVSLNGAGRVAPMVKAGKLKALGVTSLKRMPSLPDVPSIDEAGAPGLYVSYWHGMWAPKGTPAPAAPISTGPGTIRRCGHEPFRRPT